MAIYTCPTCSQDDFENAVYHQAAAGDTIVLPAGSATWGNSGRANAGIIYLTTPGLIVIGQGDNTVITLDDSGATFANGVIALWTNGVIKDLKIIGSSVNPVTAIQVAPYMAFSSGFRVSNVTFEGGTADGYFVFCAAGITNGLIDQCRISGNSGSAELIFGRGPVNAWQSSNTLGGPNNIFIEDCTFNGTGYVCDANANAQFVVRFNTITGTNKVDAHGLASNQPARSFRNIEIYNNAWTETGAGNWSNIEVRGGTSRIFNNTSVVGDFFLHDYAYDAEPMPWANFGYAATVTAGTPTLITTAAPHGYATGWPVWCEAPLGIVYGFYTITVTGTTTFTIPITTSSNEVANFVTTYKTPFDYPIKDQVGNGIDGGSREPAYVFGNTQSSAAWGRVFGTVCADSLALYHAQTGNPSLTFTDANVIQSNRDFYSDAGFDTNTGVSVGTTAQMNALTPGFAGYGFWVTDQGNWNGNVSANSSGLLYTWNGSAWAPQYTPYTYPHPLRAMDDYVLTPYANPVAGTYYSQQTVTLACDTVNSAIYYTLDGSDPVTPEIPVDTPVATPGSGQYLGAQSVTLFCATPGSLIYYTLDGSDPFEISTLNPGIRGGFFFAH